MTRVKVIVGLAAMCLLIGQAHAAMLLDCGTAASTGSGAAGGNFIANANPAGGSGTVAGTIYPPAGYRPGVYDIATGNWTAIAPANGWPQGQPYGSNAAGVFVGMSRSGGSRVAVVMDPGNGYASQVLPSTTISEPVVVATGISSDGSVISGDAQNWPQRHPIVWENGLVDEPTALPIPTSIPGGYWVESHTTTANGQIIADSQQATVGALIWEKVNGTWEVTQTGGLQNSGQGYWGGHQGHHYGANSDATMTVGAQWSGSHVFGKVSYYDGNQDGWWNNVHIDLPVSGNQYEIARDANDGGWVVGSYRTASGDWLTERAFVYDFNTDTPQDLNDLLSAADQANWILASASMIDNNGTVTGTMYPASTTRDKENHAYVLYGVPEPTTMGLLAVGLVGLLRKRR